MAKDKSILQMVIVTKVCIKKGDLMVREDMNGQMGVTTKEHLKWA